MRMQYVFMLPYEYPRTVSDVHVSKTCVNDTFLKHVYKGYFVKSLRFCHMSDGRHGFEKNSSSCTVSYTALPMKTDLYFQPTLSTLQNVQQTSIQLFFVFLKTLRNCVALT